MDTNGTPTPDRLARMKMLINAHVLAYGVDQPRQDVYDLAHAAGAMRLGEARTGAAYPRVTGALSRALNHLAARMESAGASPIEVAETTGGTLVLAHEAVLEECTWLDAGLTLEPLRLEGRLVGGEGMLLAWDGNHVLRVMAD